MHVCVCCGRKFGVMLSRGVASASAGRIWLALIRKATGSVFLISPPSIYPFLTPRLLMRYRILGGPETPKLDGDNGNHQIVGIISCQGYQSSSDVIGRIYASRGSFGWPAEREEQYSKAASVLCKNCRKWSQTQKDSGNKWQAWGQRSTQTDNAH